MTEVGFFSFHARRAAVDDVVRAATLQLLTSATWGASLRYFSSVATPGHKLWRRPGMIPAKKLCEVADDALRSDSVSMAVFATASDKAPSYRRPTDNVPGYREIAIDRDASDAPFSATYGERPIDADIAPWIQEVVTFLDAAECTCGVVAVMDKVTSECSGVGIWRNDRLLHPFPSQHERMRGANAAHMGTRYMRFPRWGTLVGHAHVAQLGGVDAITAAVKPALVRSLSAGVYFQITDNVSNAMSAESMAKQHTFTDFAAPLLPPPIEIPV